MRVLALLLACLLAGLVPKLQAQDTSFVIAGRVVDRVSGEPLARAAVSLEAISPEEEGIPPGRNRDGARRQLDTDSPPLVVTTGSDGGFRFAGLPQGRYHLAASRRGYERANFEEHASFYAAVICGPKHPEATRLQFSMAPLGSIRGTVLDSSGDPVEVATVQLYRESTDGSGAVRLRQTGSLQHGSSHFSFGDLAPGTYFLAVTGTPWFAINGQGNSGAVNSLDVAYPPVFFNGAVSADAAQPIVLRGGETAQANFSLHAMPAVHIKVAAGEGNDFFAIPQMGTPAFDSILPVSSGWVGYGGQPGSGAGTTFTAAVAPGTYAIQSGAGERAMQVTGDASLDRPTDAALTAPLSGKLAMADGSALPAGLRVQLLPEDAGEGRQFSGFMDGGHAGQARGLNRRPLDVSVGADGRFAANAVPPGKYRLSPHAEGPMLVVTGIAASGAEAASDLSLSIGTDSAIVAATLAPADHAVSGQVLTAAGQPADGMMVLLVPETPLSAALTYQQESDSDGSWSLYGIVAGRYRAIAIRDGWDLAWKQPSVLARYLGEAVEVTVAASGVITLPEPVIAQAR